MSKNSFYWFNDGTSPLVPPAPPGSDSMEAPLSRNLRMPTDNYVGLFHSTDDATLGYLKQRDLKASLRPLETCHYAFSYWSRCRAV
jgi:hypothetical protein